MTSHNSTAHHSSSANWFIRIVAQGSSMPPWKRRTAYLLVAAVVMAILWVPAGLVVTLSKPAYTSKWALILPGSGSGHAVNLDSIGQASAFNSSPYAGTSLDPKVNYKAIAESFPVLNQAARSLGMTLPEFGNPTIKLKDQTSLIYFSVSATSAQMAQDKSYALYHALQQQLERLRADESSSREQAVHSMLDSFSNKLVDAQNNMLSFQAGSSILSTDQFNELTLSIERLRSRRNNLQVELKGLEKKVQTLGNILNLEPAIAADAMSLQQDQVFQRLLETYAQSAALHAEYIAKWGSRHPRVVNIVQQQKKSKKALLQRSQQLLRKSIPVERLLTLGINDNRVGLFQELVTLHTQMEGKRSENSMLGTQIDEFQKRLESITGEAASLEDLKRKQQVATAVFTTALAKLDMGKSDLYSSYPLVQLLMQPSLPQQPDNLKRILALGGAAAGSLFCLIALGLLWIRKPYLRKILTKE